MTSSHNPNEWETSPSKETLVQTPSSTIWLSTRGPPRLPNQPVIIFEAGMYSTGIWWSPVERSLPPSLRTYHYDRAGLGRSTPSTAPRTAGTMAQELIALLQAVDVKPPYILVAHSYGGVVAREFLARIQPCTAVRGLVLVDTNTEHYNARLRIPSAALEAVYGGLDFMAVTDLGRDHKFTAAELARYKQDEEASTADETEFCFASLDALGRRGQFEARALGDRPVVVIMGNQHAETLKVLAYADAHGIGTPGQREELRAYAARHLEHSDALQREQMRLSSNSRFVFTEKSGHCVQLSEPQLVADEIVGVFRQVSQMDEI